MTSSLNLLWTYTQQGPTQIAGKFRPPLNRSLRILGIKRSCCRFVYGTYLRDCLFVGIFLALSKGESHANFLVPFRLRRGTRRGQRTKDASFRKDLPALVAGSVLPYTAQW